MQNRFLRIAARSLALAFLLTALLPAHNTSALEQDGQGWLVTTARGPIYGKWKLYLEAQPRFGGDGVQQLILRPAVGYQITDRWSLWQGYGWTPSYHPSKSENRIFQQSIHEIPRDRFPFSITNRTRLEERWIEGVTGVSLRLRHMLRAVMPMGASGKWALVAYDEPFLTLNDASGGPASGFSQNRAFVGVNRELMPGIHIEVGYLNQYIHSSGKEDTLNHNALLWLDYQW